MIFEFTLLNVSVILFSLFALSRVFLRFKEHQLTLPEAILWSGIWVAPLVIILIPSLAHDVSNLLGISTRKPIDTLIYVALVLLFYLVYRMYAKQEQLKHEFTKLVRVVSIQQARKK
jgi:hypothetical protein